MRLSTAVRTAAFGAPSQRSNKQLQTSLSPIAISLVDPQRMSTTQYTQGVEHEGVKRTKWIEAETLKRSQQREEGREKESKCRREQREVSSRSMELQNGAQVRELTLIRPNCEVSNGLLKLTPRTKPGGNMQAVQGKCIELVR